MCKCGPHSAAQGLGWALFVSPVGYLSVLCITPLRVAPLFSLPDNNYAEGGGGGGGSSGSGTDLRGDPNVLQLLCLAT